MARSETPRERRTGEPRWGGVLPGLAVLRAYQRDWLRPDLLAGITVAAYLVPQVMAYAEVAGLPPVTGLWATIGPLLVYAVLGSSRQLSVGPESTTALMTASAVGGLVAVVGADRYADAAAALALAVGAVCGLAWLLRLGFLADLLSRPVLVGYMVGIAGLRIVRQLGKLTGLSVDGDSPAQEVWFLLTHLGDVNVGALVVSAAVVAALFAFRRWAPTWPGPLVALLAAAAAVALFDLNAVGISVIGEVPRGLPAPRVPDVTGLDPAALLTAALGVALVGYSDNVLTGRAFATRHGQSIDASQEFLALGASNAAAGLLQGFPVSSSGSRTVLADTMGNRTQVYSLVALATVLATMYFLSPVLAAFPVAALGGVVVYAAIRLVDLPELRRIARFRRSELVLSLATTVAVLAFDVLVGIGIAVSLSLLDLLRRIAQPHDGVLGYVPGLAGMHDIDDYPTATQVPGLVVYRYDSPMFFANAENFLSRALAAVDAARTPTEWFLLNAEANTEVDLTSVDALDRLREALAARGVTFAMARVKQDLRDQLSAAGFTDRVGADLIFPTLPTAVAGYVAAYTARHGTPPPGPVVPPPAATGSL